MSEIRPMRVLLIKSFSLLSKVTAASPPLGVMALAAYLRREAGADVRILNPRFSEKPLDELRRTLGEFKPHLVGLSALTAEAHVMHLMAREVRAAAPDALLAAGGPHASAYYEAALGSGDIDVAVIGEGELTLLEIVRRLEADGVAALRSPEALSQIAGVAYLEDAGERKILLSAPRPLIEDLDSLPLPAWDLVDLKPFWKHHGMSNIGYRPYMAIYSSRGCPFQCSYCHNLFGKRFRARSAENVVEEIVEIERRMGVKDIEFFDDIANMDRKRINAILEGLLARGMHPRLSFPNGIRADRMEEDTIDLLKKVGTGEISVAIESATPRIQKLVGKNLNIEKASLTIERLAARRIYARGFFMIGFPTETEAEIRQTIDFACASKLHTAMFYAVNPYEGTRMKRQFVELGKFGSDLNTIDYEFFGAPFNGSEVDDETFRELYRSAYARFYLNPVRMARIARDRPYKRDIPYRIAALITQVVSFKRLQEKRVEARLS